MAESTRLVVLDRDGVINFDSDAFIKSPAEWMPIEGSLEAIALMSRNGFTVAVATNQSGIARSLYDRRALEAIHRKMRKAVAAAGGSIDRIVYCPHGPDEGCDCRKPAAGLLEELERHFGRTMRDVPIIGDSERDIVAARAVNGRPILVLTGNGRRTLETFAKRGESVETYDNLLAAAVALVAAKAGGAS